MFGFNFKLRKCRFGVYRMLRYLGRTQVVQDLFPAHLKRLLKKIVLNLVYERKNTVNEILYSREKYTENHDELTAKELVTIIMPTFNQSDYLQSSIRSVLEQTYSNYELIIVNDGSTDKTIEILRQYQDHPNIRIYQQENQGLPNSLNYGLLKSRGKLITWTSSDNVMLPKAIDMLVSGFLKNPDASLVYGDYEVIDENDVGLDLSSSWRIHNRFGDVPSHVKLPRDGELRLRMPDNFIGPYFMFSRTVFRQIGNFARIQGIEDYDYWLRCERVGPIKHIENDSIQYQYRVHGNTLSANYKQLKILENVEILTQIQALRDMHKDEKEVTPELTENNCAGFRVANGWANRVARPFRILFLLDSWGIGGLEIVVVNQIRYFSKQGCEIKVIISQNERNVANSSTPVGAIFAASSEVFSKIVLSWNPDVTLAHYAFRYLSILDSMKVPYMQVFHNSYLWLNSEEVERLISLNQNSIANICVSNSVLDYSVKKFKLDPSHTYVVPNGINVQDFNLEDKDIKIFQDPHCIVAATYTPHKRQAQILEAFARVSNRFPKARITFVGDVASQDYYQMLISRAQQLNLSEKVNFQPFTPTLTDLYQTHQIAISASLFEGWSLSLSEAAYLGKSIVATNVGAAEELSKYTRVYLVQNYPENLFSVNNTNLYDFASNLPDEFIVNLSTQIAAAMNDFYEDSKKTYIKNEIGWELDVDYSSSIYFDHCVEAIRASRKPF
jgi:glycosyltransferase involved in cell wall biosynthesis